MGDHLQAGGHHLRPASPAERDLDRDRSTDHRSTGRSAHPHSPIRWATYRAATIAASGAGVIIIITWRLITDW
jgi:hypothetical protein